MCVDVGVGGETMRSPALSMATMVKAARWQRGDGSGRHCLCVDVGVGDDGDSCMRIER